MTCLTIEKMTCFTIENKIISVKANSAKQTKAALIPRRRCVENSIGL
jgi:hypothetical protein